MELLPIIYVSLIVFSALAVIVIITSYISFKFRQKFGSEEKNEILVDLTPITVSPSEKARLAKLKAKKNKDSRHKKSKLKKDNAKDSIEARILKNRTKPRIEILNPIKINDETESNLRGDENEILKHYSDADSDGFFTIRKTKS